jgi:Domain of unknown function (DUF4232)
MHRPTHFKARLASAAAIACAAALMPVTALAATGFQAASAGTASSPRCATSGLVVWLDVPPGHDFAGGAGYDLEFTNLSGRACTLRGYPGVSAVSLSGRQLGSPAGWGAPVATMVRLARGATATAHLQINDPGGYGTRCLLPPPWKQPWRPGTLPTAAGLRVYPPGQFTSKVIPYPFRACAHAGPVYIHTGPVTAGGPPDRTLVPVASMPPGTARSLRRAGMMEMMSNPNSRRFPVTVTHLPVARCEICQRTVAYSPGNLSEVLTEHYRRAHPEALAIHPR